MKATFNSVLKMNCTRVRASNAFSLEKTSGWILYGSRISWDILYALMFVLECWCEREYVRLMWIRMKVGTDCSASSTCISWSPEKTSIIVEWERRISESQIRQSRIDFNKKDDWTVSVVWEGRRDMTIGASRRVCFTIFVPSTFVNNVIRVYALLSVQAPTSTRRVHQVPFL